MSNEHENENLNNLDDLESTNIQFDDELEDEHLQISPEDEVIDLSVNENGGKMPTKTKITLAIGLLLAAGSLTVVGYTKLFSPTQNLPIAESQEPLFSGTDQMLDTQFNASSTEKPVNNADISNIMISSNDRESPEAILQQLENPDLMGLGTVQSDSDLMPGNQPATDTSKPPSTTVELEAEKRAKEELKAVNQELDSKAILISDLTEQNTKLSNDLKGSHDQLKSASALNLLAKSTIDQLRTDLVNKSIEADNLRDELSNLKLDSSDGLLSNSEIKQLINERNRLPGFRVVGSSKDHSMSILSTPSKRISVFFKGEKLIDRDNGVMTVDSVHHQGQIVLIGSKWFVDETLKERKEVKRPSVKRKVKETQKVTEVASNKESSSSKTVDVSKLHISMNWEVNSIYNHKGDPRYLISSKSGDWKTVKIGDHLPNLGIVKGHIPNQGVVIGKTLVKVIKD